MMSDDHYLTFLEPLNKHLVLQDSFALLFKDGSGCLRLSLGLQLYT